MKIRMGFVSNSSSSSFCIYGIALSDVEFDMESMRKEGETEDDVESYDLRERFEEKADKFGLEVDGSYDMGYWLGKSWKKIGDKETGEQFKANIEKQIAELFKSIGFKPEKEVKCSTHEEAWHD